jgi:hypothetical protein
MTDLEAQVHMPELVAPVHADGSLDVKEFLKHIYYLYDDFLVQSSFFYLINHDGATPQEVQELYIRIKNMYATIIDYLKLSIEFYNPWMTKNFRLIGKKGREADSYMRAVDKALKIYNKKQLTLIF